MTLSGCRSRAKVAGVGVAADVTRVEMTEKVEMAGVERLGINLGDQSYYDSGMMRKDLIFRNPGFEGMAYTSIVRCTMQGDVCTDRNNASGWPAGFWTGARYETIAGETVGSSGTVASMTAADKTGGGAQMQLAGEAVHTGDAVVLHKYFPGDPLAGWWPDMQGGAKFEAESTDMPPGTRGKQSLHLDATMPGAAARVHSYFDTFPKMTFLRLEGSYRLRFKAKALAGSRAISVDVGRFLPQWRGYGKSRVALSDAWKEYSVPFEIHETPDALGSLALTLEASGAELLLDDVSFEKVDGDPANHTVYRDEVVQALKDFHPGTLRYMASNGGMGSLLENQLLPPEARARTGYSAWSSRSEDVPTGLVEFLDLCRAIHADPWIVIPTATTAMEATRWIEVLAAYKVEFGHIYLELGNETWNTSFTGETLDDPVQYGKHAGDVFSAMRSVPEYDAGRFQLVLGGQAVSVDRNKEIVKAAKDFDLLAIAPYFANKLDQPTDEAQMYRDLMGEPEAIVRDGFVAQQDAMLRKVLPGKKLAFYEVNLSTLMGSAGQDVLDRYVSSLAAGLSVANMMLEAQAKLHVQTQQMFTLAQIGFKRGDGSLVRLWGSVLDMGVTNRRRPQFLALELANRAIGGDLLVTNVSGEDPTWTRSASDDVAKAKGLHEITAYAYKDGSSVRLLVMNLSVTTAHKILLAGVNAPSGGVHVTRLEGVGLGATNEEAERVTLKDGGDAQGGSLLLPAGSMTLVTWSR